MKFAYLWMLVSHVVHMIPNFNNPSFRDVLLPVDSIETWVAAAPRIHQQNWAHSTVQPSKWGHETASDSWKKTHLLCVKT